MKKIDLFDVGLTEFHSKEASLYTHLYVARVSAQFKNIYKIITENGELSAEVSGKLNHCASNALEYPAVGDWVLVDRVEDNSGNAIIHRILSRKSCFKRKAAGTGIEEQIIATNIDIIFICMSINNDFNLRRTERYLSICWDSQAVPVIVLTKSDLCDDVAKRLSELSSVASGVDILITSSVNHEGFEEIHKYLKRGITIAFIGSSGVGKSTLINKLVGHDVMITKQIRTDDDRGRHATTHRQLFVLPEGGIVLDSPGMRELQISHADLSKSFADIEELANQCRFSDCQHQTEPHCAIKKAIEEERLSLERFENYKKLQKEIIFFERKNSMTSSQLEKQKVVDVVGSFENYKQLKKRSRHSNRK